MPLYEYLCQACGQPSEISHRMSDPPATVCPKCGKPELVKQISAAGFRLKGAGWYETDFKSSNKRNLVEGGDGGKSAEAKSDGGSKHDSGGSGGDGGRKSTPTPAPSAPASSSTPSSGTSSS